MSVQSVSTHVTRLAPDFEAKAVMPDGEIKAVKLSDFVDPAHPNKNPNCKYVLLVFFPLAFTYVCPTELLALNNAIQEFKDRKVQVLVCSVDSPYALKQWTQQPIAEGGVGKLAYPLVSDISHAISKAYHVYYDDASVAFRGTYLIDNKGIVRHMSVNDLPLGRSVEEMVRTVDALVHVEEHGEVCPANWKKGAKAMKATDEGLKQYMSNKSA